MSEKLGFKERFSYSLGSLACNLVWTSLTGFMVIFYTDVAFVSAAMVGIIVVSSRLFDASADVIFGIIIDRTKHPKGKARPWLLRMAIPFGIATFLCFNAFPDWPVTARIVYAFITFNLLSTIMYTTIDMPYGVLNAALSQDQYERSVLNIFRLFMAIVAGTLVNIMVPQLTAAFGGGARGWRITFLIIGVVSAVLLIITYLNTKERVEASARIKDDVPLKVGFKALFRNKYWIMIAIYAVLSYAASGLGGMTPFFAREVLGDFGMVGTLAIFGVLPMIIGALVLAPIVKRIGRRNSALIGIASGLTGGLMVAILGTDIMVIFAATTFRAFGSAFIIGTMFAMFADTIEYGEWKSGVRTAGLVYSASAFGANVGNGIGTAIVSFALSMGGYVAIETFGHGPTGQSQTALNAISFVFIWMPIIFLTLMAVIMFMFNLDKEYPAILAELKARKGEIAEEGNPENIDSEEGTPEESSFEEGSPEGSSSEDASQEEGNPEDSTEDATS